MKKRLRKKLHKAEFKELGFEFQFDLLDTMADQNECLDVSFQYIILPLTIFHYCMYYNMHSDVVITVDKTISICTYCS